VAKLITKSEVRVVRETEHPCFRKLDLFFKGFCLGSDYCFICGEKLTEERLVEWQECSSCGEICIFPQLQNEKAVRFNYCPKCGSKFDDLTQ